MSERGEGAVGVRSGPEGDAAVRATCRGHSSVEAAPQLCARLVYQGGSKVEFGPSAIGERPVIEDDCVLLAPLGDAILARARITCEDKG